MRISQRIKIESADGLKDAILIEKLARDIWYEHYTDIIGTRQVEYMLRKYQTSDKIMDDIINAGYIYHLARYDGIEAGYCAIRIDEADDRLFLSKLYVKKQFRKLGIASAFMDIITRYAKERSLSKIWLTVNKDNKSSIEAYMRMGFCITGDILTDIGCGYYMDDHIMEREIERRSI